MIPIGTQLSMSGTKPSIDGRFGPYDSIQDAYNTLTAEYQIISGMEFGIKNIDNTITRYCWTKSGSDATVNDIKLLSIEVDNYYTKTEIDGKGYLTEHQSLSGYYTKTEIDNKGYLTSHQSLSNYYNKSEINSKETALSDRIAALEANAATVVTVSQYATMIANGTIDDDTDYDVQYQE